MSEVTYSKAITQNLIHMNTSPDEWSALPIEKFTITENEKGLEIVMPEFKFPVNYANAPTLYTGECCGWCGHKIKNVFWIVNHNRQWVLPVGSECIKSFIELTSEQEQDIKASATIKPEEIEQINNRIATGQTIKQAVTITRKLNTIEKNFLKKYPEPNEELENWFIETCEKWHNSFRNNNRELQRWGLKWYGLNWIKQYESAIDYLILNHPNKPTAHDLWEKYKVKYIEKKSKNL